MAIVFRLDASEEIGYGHLYRCLVLADKLKFFLFKCIFLIQEPSADIAQLISAKGHDIISINRLHVNQDEVWPEKSQVADAKETIKIIASINIDWLVVDHYCIGGYWEEAVRKYANKIMVIDDLANRTHSCDLLLDQDVSYDMLTRYDQLVEKECHVICGPKYALLRPEFSELRRVSLEKKLDPVRENLLIFMGGGNLSKKLESISFLFGESNLGWRNVNIVTYDKIPEILNIKQFNKFSNLKWHHKTTEMAQLLAEADLALTSGGGITWEKCCLGVPSLVVVTAQNQLNNANMLNEIGAQIMLGKIDKVQLTEIASNLKNITNESLVKMTLISKELCDGLGADRVVKMMLAEC